MSNTVWVGNNLDVAIFLEDAYGNPIGMVDPNSYDPAIDTPVLTYCFFDTADVDGTLNAERRPVTGRSFQKIVTQDFFYTMSVSHMYFIKSEFDQVNIFNRTKRLTIVMRFYDLTNAAIPANMNEQYIMKHSIGKAFSIKSKDNQISYGSANFWGEEFVVT